MLAPAPLSGIEALILHPRRERIGREVLREAVREALEQICPDSEVSNVGGDDPNSAAFVLDFNHIEVIQDCDPLQVHDFQDILALDATLASFPNAETVLQDHQCVTKVSFMKGDARVEHQQPGAAFAGFAAGSMIQRPTFRTPGEFLEAMAVTSGILEALRLLMLSSALMWKHNGVIMSPERFRMLNSPELVELLSVRPDFFEGPDTPDGRETLGLSVYGSEYLIGKRVVFEAAPVPMEYLVEQALAFLKTCLMRDDLLPDGDLFGADIKEQIRVRYSAARSSHDVGSIRLTVETSTSNNIVPDLEPAPLLSFEDEEGVADRGWSETDEAALDPNDPIDAAILARLRDAQLPEAEDEAEKPSPATPVVEPVEEPRIAKPLPEEFSSKPIVAEVQPRAPRTSIAELRKFAADHRVPDLSETKPAGASSAFGKFGSALSGLLRRKDQQ
ncbi:hypothetical protein [Roseibium sediminis]|uniref:hypothetical protein n=1 Tax=Roseibium sediminis TaxID=1775174 RepID=UPI00123D5EFA|nr:hypothetical protein [Roseibium sediminis]